MFVRSWLASLSASRRRARRQRGPLRKSLVRRGLLEKMEHRCLLASDWHNAFQPADVTGDELVTLSDLVAIVGDMRVNGPGALPELAAGTQPPGYFDTSNDGVRSVSDIVLVVNALRDPASGQVALSEVSALSNHYFAATFNRPARGQLLTPEAYTLLGPDGNRLPILEVFAGADPQTVILATASQQAVDYTLQARVSNTLVGEGEAVGSTSPEPSLQTAIALNSTSVLLTFSDSLDAATAQNKDFYRIVAGNDATPSEDVGHIRIESAVLGANKRTVTLTTSPMENVEYSVKATNVIGASASKFIDPTRNTTTFFGLPHSNGLTLVSADSTGAMTILLNFSEPLDANSIDLSDFVVTYIPQGGSPPALPLVVTGYELDDTGTQITLSTFPQPAGATFMVQVSGLLDIAGKALPPATSTSFQTPEILSPPEEGLPRVVGAAAINNTTVLVAFSRPMGPSALDPEHYVIAQLNENPEAGALTVVNAEYLSSDNHATIKLTTLPQNELAYMLTVVDVRDETGKALAPPSSEHVDPTRAVFPGTPHSGPAVDTDSDGLPDSEELRGWIVTIALANQTIVQRGVTSDPTLADTDGDGILDRVELATHSDPRDADTDDDELPDVEELNDRRGDPTRQDTDTDGLTDLAEKIGWTVNITLEDGSVVNQQVTSNPYLADTDFDGLLDLLEQLTQVDPRNPDSDGDGASDGDEVLDGGNPGASNPEAGAIAKDEKPRVVGAASLSNTTVLVSFSEAMADNALTTSHYFIVQQNVNPEVGFLPILSAVFNSEDRRSVLLTTGSQNELTYSVTALNVTDLDGNSLAPAVLASNLRIDPTTALFPGTPPSGVQFVDSDGDGLSDNVEVRGWVANITMLDGSVIARQVTSNPGDPTKDVDDPVNVAARDADGDGLPDPQELNLGIDPRSADTDGDQLNDFAEFNEIYSNPASQDTDGDTLDDFLEFAFFKTSAVFADTDGDQITDGDEILGNRNARVSDLPRPEIEVGEINLQLDVRFTENNARESRDLETRTIATTLSASESKGLTRQHTANVEAHIEAGFGDGTSSVGAFFRGGVTAGYTFQQTEESTNETQRSYEDSFETQEEVTAGFSVERQVVGAVMQATVSLRNVSNLAYRVKNLQVTAFIQDPQDHKRLIPVATLLPDNEPEEGFTLGPLVTNRGPLIFSNDTIVPALVESLMANSSGLIFRISNYDIINEDGRNFAFISQDVVERTGQVIIDFGGARSLRAQVSGEPIDENVPGDETEIHRVSTSAGQVIDTNFDGMIDDNDRPATFDAAGKEVGITLFEALAAVGLERFEARLDPVTGMYVDHVPGEDTPVDVSLPTEEDRILNSYSTFVDDTGRERIFRIRGVANDLIIEKYWEILTPRGIDQQTDLEDLILKTDAPISLNFVQDLDEDLLPADVEFLLRTSDSPELVNGVAKGRDTDGDGLDDRFEALIGWSVSTPLQTYTAYSSPNRRDSNFDTPKPGADSDGDGIEDRLEYDGSDGNVAPAGWTDNNSNGLRDRFEVFRTDANDLVLDPIRKDTDRDGINDATELIGFIIIRIEDGSMQHIPRTNPLTPFSDSDTFTDGFEKVVGLDPNDGTDTDEDGDSLPDKVEQGPGSGWEVRTFGVSTSPFQQGAPTTIIGHSRTDSVDSDEDGLTDYEEFFLKTNAESKDTDGDGIEDRIEHLGYFLGHDVGGKDIGIIKTDPLDADTDNDKRSDGAEAELKDIELARWVVRVDGQAPRQVFSNPLVADADFDFLVDGDEFAFGTDPNNGNTDGDARDDGKEFTAGTNPLVEDFQVTVYFTSITITDNGDGGSNAGDIGFDLGIRKPDSSQPAGLSSIFTSAVRANLVLTDPFTSFLTGGTSEIESRLPLCDKVGSDAFDCSLQNNDSVDLDNDPNTPPTAIYGIPFADGATLRLPGLLPENLRSVSFGMTKNDFFAIEGVIVERDSGPGDTYVYLGGLEGVRAEEKAMDDEGNEVTTTIRPVFHGQDLLASPQRFHDLTFTFTTADNIAGGNERIAGSVSLFFIVS